MSVRLRWSAVSRPRFLAKLLRARGCPAALRSLALVLALGMARAATPPSAVPATPIGAARVGPRGTPALASGWMQQSFASNGVTATFAIPGDAVPAFGFVPVRVTIDNPAPRELRWQADFAQSSYAPLGQSEAETTRPLLVPPGRGSERWVFVPIADAGVTRNYRGGFFASYGSFMVNVAGPVVGSGRVNFSSGGRANAMVPWAVSAALEPAVRARIGALTTTTPPPGRGSPPLRRVRGPAASSAPAPATATTATYSLVSGPPNLTVFDLGQPCGDARIFLPFTRFVMGLEEYAVLNPVTKAAVRNWVAFGGWLYLSPEQARPDVAPEAVGVGRIVTLARPVKDEGDDAQGLFAPTGLFELTPALPNVGDLTLQSGTLPGLVPRAKRVGDWLIYFFVGFAALVAPINLLLIAPVKRRHRLFFSLPGISAAAVAVLAVAIFTQDGVVGEGARRALVVLLPGDNAAAVFQDQISRTGLLLKSTFPLPEDTICAELTADDPNFAPGRALQFDRQDGVASGDWFRGRTRQAQHLRRIVPTRARLERVGQAADGAPIVQSSVGAPLRHLVYFDAAGVAWTAERVPLGQPVTLRRLANASEHTQRLGEFASSASLHFKQLVRGATELAAPHRFVAFADPTELAPIPTLASVTWKDSEVLLAGVVAGAGAGGAR